MLFLFFFATLSVFVDAQLINSEIPINFRIVIPTEMETQLPAESTLEAAEGTTDVEEAGKFKNVYTLLGRVNGNLDLAQNALYLIRDIVSVIMSLGDKFQDDFLHIQDQFKEKPKSLSDLKRTIGHLKERLPQCQNIVDQLKAAGMNSEDMEKASNALTDLIANGQLDQMTQALEEVPNEIIAAASGDNLSTNMKPGPLSQGQPQTAGK